MHGTFSLEPGEPAFVWDDPAPAPADDPHSDCESCESCGRCSCETSTDVYLDSTIGYGRLCPECRSQELRDAAPDPSETCAEFSIEDVRAHIAGSAILGAPAPAQDARSSQHIEWEHTRRGLIGLAEIRTPRPSGSDLVSVLWFTESGDTGREDGSDARAMAITSAYVAMVRRANGTPEWMF